MRVVVVGTGYVGLVSGVCFAELGNEVVCVDIVKEKVEKLRRGETPIFEPGLEELLKKNISKQSISFTTDLSSVADTADVVFIALPTPPSGDGSADLSAVLRVSEELGKIIKSYTLIVNKSTVPVGTAEKVRNAIEKNYSGSFDVVSNPEFLKEGFAVEDFMNPDRIVIGVNSKKPEKIMRELYGPLIKNGAGFFVVDTTSSEMIKYAANSFLAIKITFANEIANLCEKVGANIVDVMDGVGADSRIGRKFLYPGIGYGGSCFPKDIEALIFTANEHNSPMKLLEATVLANYYQKSKIVQKIKEFYGGNIKNKKFALWGLAFKPNTDDIREAPAQTIIKELNSLGASVVAFDPEAIDNTKQIIKGLSINYASDMYEATLSADALIIATEWDDFKKSNLKILSDNLKEKVIFDGRNMFNPKNLLKEGFYYNSVGRMTVDGRK